MRMERGKVRLGSRLGDKVTSLAPKRALGVAPTDLAILFYLRG